MLLSEITPYQVGKPNRKKSKSCTPWTNYNLSCHISLSNHQSDRFIGLELVIKRHYEKLIQPMHHFIFIAARIFKIGGVISWANRE